jgi:hypothetical protein
MYGQQNDNDSFPLLPVPPKKKQQKPTDNDFPILKKKEVGSGGSLLGADVGALGGLSTENKSSDNPLGIRSVEGTPELVEHTDIKVDENDPLGSAYDVLKSARDKIINRNLASDNTRVNNSKVIDDTRKVNDINATINHTIATAFPTIESAQKWADTHPYEEKNKTSQEAHKILIDNGIATRSLQNHAYYIPDAAVEYYRMVDNPARENLQQMHREGIPVPNEMKADLTAQFFQNRTVQELAKHNPKFKEHLHDEQYNYYLNFPEAREKKLLGDLGQGLEDYGKNNWFLNLHGAKRYAEVAEHLVRDGKWKPNDLEFFVKNTFPKLLSGEENPKTPGLIENIYGGAKESVQDVAKGVYEATGLRDLMMSQGNQAYSNMQEKYSEPTPTKFSGLHRLTQASGNLIGTILPLGAGSKRD